MNKQTFLEYNEIGWDYAIEQLARNNQDKIIRDLIDIYYMGYKHMVNDDPDDGLCFKLRQFAIKQILNLLED